jgi:4-oxalocrotonate tautomerase
MPIVRIELAKGRTKEEKEKLMKAVTEAIHHSIDAPLPTIHIMIKETPEDEIMIGGELLVGKSTKDKV